MKNETISEGILAVAVAVGPFAAFICLASIYTNDPVTDLTMNTFMGTFWVLTAVHLFFRDENLDKLGTINRVIWVISPLLIFLFIHAFILEAYYVMFGCLGFLIVLYLFHLLIGALKLERQNPS